MQADIPHPAARWGVDWVGGANTAWMIDVWRHPAMANGHLGVISKPGVHVNVRRASSAVSMLAHRLRRWASNDTALAARLVCSGVVLNSGRVW